MRKLVTLAASALILAVSYIVAFGVPETLGVISGTEISSAKQPENSVGVRQAGRPNGASSTTVVLTPLETRPYVNIMRAVGSAEALRSAEVIANAEGEVIEVNLNSNQHVSVDDVLVQLDARTEVFNLEIAQAALDQARETVLRYERLARSSSSTITDVALSDARVAERLAEANVGLAQVALDNRTIRSPISGKLGLSAVENGDVLSAESVVVTIDDAEVLLVEFELPERSVGMLTTDKTVLANTPSFVGRTFEGEIVSFDSRIDSVTRSVTVKARIANPDGLLWPGMTFSVRIIHESEPLAVLPSTAITWSRNGSSVWVENGGVAEQIPVTILFRRDEQVWVDADIAVGAMVVTEGAQKLRVGSRIVTANSQIDKAAPNEASDGDRPANSGLGQIDTTSPTLSKEPT
jgi:RND family efflux transporter MFP subunit